MFWVVRSLVVLPPENSARDMDGSLCYNLIVKHGAAVFFTSCASQAQPAVQTFAFDAKMSRKIKLRGREKPSTESVVVNSDKGWLSFLRSESHSIRNVRGVTILVRSSSPTLITPNPFSQITRSFVHGSALANGGLSPTPSPCLPCWTI
jgi:hypothetical protein